MTATLPDERFPVWDALSEFFLDTELQPSDYERISDTLAQSRYSVQELGDILYYEVYPECKWNMFCVAGEWAGFHPDWIMQRIAPRKDKRPRFCLAPFHRWAFDSHWKVVIGLVEEKRSREES
jgi:hypothetical protein